MSLLDDLTDATPPTELERRRFFALVGAGALGATGLGSTAMVVRFLVPEVVFREDRRVAVGRPEEIEPGTVLVLRTERAYLVRTERGLLALSATCTHLGCITRYEPSESGFVCPCHGSRFTGDGAVRRGPAADPLRRFRVSLEQGLVVVDAGEVVPPDFVLEIPT